MQVIYIVTSGHWSDYHIDGVFSTPEAAQACIDGLPQDNSFYEEPQVERWQLDSTQQLK
jgi:hypothetical protein